MNRVAERPAPARVGGGDGEGGDHDRGHGPGRGGGEGEGNLSDLFYRRPRLLLLALALIVSAGLSALMVLPRAEDPTLAGRVARVVVRYPGADAARVNALVAEPLERELLALRADLQKVVTTSRAGASVSLIQLADSVRDTEPVWARLRQKLDDAQLDFPPGASPPDFEVQPILAYTLIAALRWDGPGEPDLAALGRLGRALRDRLRQVPGTGEVDLWGAVPEEIHVDVSPSELSALGRSADDLARTIAQSDAKVSAGAIDGQRADLLLEVSGELSSLERVRAVPVRQARDGRVVRLGDVARVTRGPADPADELALVSGRPAVVVAARMAAGRRVDLWSASARAAVAEARAELPRHVSLPEVFEQAQYTEARLSSLAANLGLGVLLVVGVLVVLMGWRSALLVGLSLPLASFAVLGGMRLLGIPLHQMSVTGLIIALGLLIDNAIVTVDEVEARMREGHGPAAAIRAAVAQLAVPLLGSTLTTVLAFFPMVLMPGPAGEFVSAIGTTVSLALASSLFLALTVVPALRAFLAPPSAQDAGAPGQWWRHGLRTPRLEARFRAGLGTLLRRPALSAVLLATPALLGFLALRALPEQFFPPADRDQCQVELRLPPQASLAETRAAALRARELLRAHPRVEEVHWFLGRSAPKFYYNLLAGQDGAAFYAQGLVQLRGAEDTATVVAELQERLSRGLPAAQAVVRLLEQGPPFDAPVELHLYGPDPEVLRRIGDEARAVLDEVPDVVLARTSMATPRPRLTLELDEEQARLLGVEARDVARQLEASLTGARGGSVLEGAEEVAVRVRVDPDARHSLRGVESMGVFGAVAPGSDARRAAPVSALGALRLGAAPGALSRRNGQLTNSVQGFVRAGTLPSAALARFEARLQQSGFQLPPGYRLETGGESSERDHAVRNLMASAGLLLVLMIATLVLSFSSFRQAGVIAAVGLLSVGLALAALWAFGAPFGFMAIVGTMGLIGVAINDSIVVLAAIREDPAAAAGDPAAVIEVVVRSARHVIATTVTTVAGFVPLLVSGGEFWRPLAVTIAGGVAGATVLALTFVPSAFVLLVRLGMVCPLTRRAAEQEVAALG
ncbi:MAG: efflux RND transporter permease subunit [Planctomycetota bacterium]